MQAGDSYRLVVRRGPQPNQVFELKDDVINLGRDITNTISINDREVSRHHLRFARSSDGFSIEDLGSTNGTFINGKRLSGSTFLKNGDMIGLGETVTLGYEVVRPGGAANPYQAPQAPAQPPAAANPYQAPPAPQANPYQAPAQQPPSVNPYQAPPQPAANPYQAPQANPYQQPGQPANPYQQPGQPPYAGQADPYAQPVGQPDPYAQPVYGAPDPNQPYYGQQGQPGYGAPPPPGYDYDPYAMREQEPRSSTRMILIGCVGLMIFCCVFTIGAAVLVDTFNLYCQLPLLNSVFQALGLITCGAG